MTKVEFSFNSEDKSFSATMDGSPIEGLRSISYDTFKEFDGVETGNLSVRTKEEDGGTDLMKVMMWSWEFSTDAAVAFIQKIESVASHAVNLAFRKR